MEAVLYSDLCVRDLGKAQRMPSDTGQALSYATLQKAQ